MEQVLNNRVCIYNIAKFIIDPPMIINNHFYDKNGKINFEIDHEYSNKHHRLIMNQLYYAMEFTNLDFITVIYTINKMNKEWLLSGNIIFSKQYIYTKWQQSHLYRIDNTESGFTSYTADFFKYLMVEMNNVDINKFKSISEYINTFKEPLQKHDNWLKIYELNCMMKYINIYFRDYMDFINQDLNNFSAAELVEFIHTEEYIYTRMLM